MNAASVMTHNRVQKDYFGSGVKPSMVPTATPYVLRQVDRVIQAANLRPEDKILDVGCGMGKYTLPLAERGLRIEGLDLSPFLLEQFKQYDGGRFNIPLYEGDLIDLTPRLLGQYDALTGFFVLHHMHDLNLIFKACFDVLKPGGRLIFLEPNAFNPLYYFQIALTPGMTWAGDGGVAKMRKGLIFDAMRNAGLTDLKLTRFGFFPRFITNIPTLGIPLETAFESFPLWRPLLPFQLFMAAKP